MRFSPLALAILTSSALLSHHSAVNAAVVSGTVTDDRGQPITGARITVEGSNLRVLTDKNGSYTLPDLPFDHIHLHVYSENHVHGDRVIDDPDANVVADFTLRPTRIENVRVTASPLGTSILELAQPADVITKDDLRRGQAPTLGDTLTQIPGVHSTSFGPVASSPIIRGNDGPRVKIVQNGLDISDASRVGADHDTATEASVATQVEVLRGPSTLQFGSGAIGGVVNVVDRRILKEPIDSPEGEIQFRGGGAADERFASAEFNAGLGPVGLHVDGFTRSTDDAELPGELTNDEGGDTIESTAIDGDGATLGASLIGDWGHAGIAFQSLDNLYGIPGHGHGHEEGEEGGEEEEEEESVQLMVDMERLQWSTEWKSPVEGIVALRYRGASTDYSHIELEGDEIGTRFENETDEHRINLEHEGIGGWHGVIGLHLMQTDFAALGEEAFTPPSETETQALYLVEEMATGDWRWQWGLRWESTTLTPLDAFAIELHHDEDEGGEGEEPEPIVVPELDYTSISASAGAIWQFHTHQSLGLSIGRAERAPSHQEIFSAGEHIATRSFEVGLAYNLDEEGEASLNTDVREEVTQSVDLTWRVFDGPVTASVNLFLYDINDYIYQENTGLVFEEEHEEEGEEGEGHEHEEEEGLPVLAFRQQDAVLWGYEAAVTFHFNDALELELFTDWVDVELDDDSNPPRIPPLRFGGDLTLTYGDWFAALDVVWYDEQSDLAEFEVPSDGYTLVGLDIEYRLDFGDQRMDFFLRGDNLGDEEARPHTSFVKDLVPLPGRGVTLGTRFTF